jgi:hypothetical protein
MIGDDARLNEDGQPYELPETTPLFFNDGFVFDEDYVSVASQMDAYSDSAVSRVTVIRDLTSKRTPEWVYVDFEDAATSVTGVVEAGNVRRSYLMGMYGKVLVLGGGQARTEDVPYEGEHGRLLRIRAVGKTLFICGMTGQLLARQRGSWRRIDGGLLGTGGLDFEDIDGTSPADLYAVGVEGIIWHFDGKRWRDLKSPTNQRLSNVRCVSKDEIYICGNSGILMRGSARSGWQLLAQDALNDNLWGLTIFGGKPYVASTGGIHFYDGKDLRQVDFGDLKLKSFNRLDACNSSLWSFGIKQIAWFDGHRWREVVCPANT